MKLFAFLAITSAAIAAAQSNLSNITDLPDPNRVITNTQADGKSVFLNISGPLSPLVKLSGGNLRLGYATNRPPVNLTDEADVQFYTTQLDAKFSLVAPGGGALVWYIDTPPATTSVFHRTISLDFVVQLDGEIELKLDSGETRMLRTGDLTIQRATLHQWRNPSDTKWARMLGVLTQTEPVVVGNTTLVASGL